MNLDLDLRESSRGSSILSRPILTIWGDLRSTIPRALARSKFQVADRVGYILQAKARGNYDGAAGGSQGVLWGSALLRG